jgi:hypothetical protein
MQPGNCGVYLPRRVVVNLGSQIALVPLERVRSQLVRIHGGNGPAQVVKAVDGAGRRMLVLLAARKVDLGGLLNPGEVLEPDCGHTCAAAHS